MLRTKHISVLLLCAAALPAADFTTGQAARLVIGQTTFTSQDPASSDTILGAPSGVAYANNTLFVADSNRVGAAPSNHRLLIYDNLSSQLPAPTDALDHTKACPACVGQANVVLGQPNFTTTSLNMTPSSSNLRLPTAVASDGVRLVVADTDHNRVLIWNRIPTVNNTPADVVLGQPDMTSNVVPANKVPSASSLLGPQGVWIQNGKLYVADTQNSRVLIWNRIPTTNGAPADMVLGQPDFTSSVGAQTPSASATNMLNPVSATTDGTRLYVTDLGYNRVLVWRTLPATNDAPADFALGQPDLTSSYPNYAFTVDATDKNKETPVLCTESNGVDANNNPTYPTKCSATLSFPRFALPAGNRLFVADGGNDRVLVFQQIPDKSGASADVVLGQIGGEVNQARNAADSLRTPMGLAWDGTNLYVSDCFNRRVTVYSVGENSIPYSGIRNGASFEVFSTGSVQLSGTIKAGDVVTITISRTVGGVKDSDDYSYTVLSSDTLNGIVDQLVAKINSSHDGAGDPYVVATADHANTSVRMTSKISGEDGNSIDYSVKASSAGQLSAQAAGANLTGGADAAQLAPGSLVSIFPRPGAVLAYAMESADLSKDTLPTELAGTQVYMNGVRAPLLYVSPDQINAQIPWEMNDTTSVNAWVRSMNPAGTVVATTPVAISIVPANPGIFTYFDTGTPPVAVALHGSSSATGVVSVDGGITEGDVGTITINGRSYSYTVKTDDTLKTVAASLSSLINASDPEVTATPTAEFARIVLHARVQGPDGEGIPYSAAIDPAPVAAGGSLVLTTFTTNLCCSNVQYSLVGPQNPAAAGETILVYSTGIGLPSDSDRTKYSAYYQTGVAFPPDTPAIEPGSSVSSQTQGVTANVLEATPKPGTFGVFEVELQLQSTLNADPLTKLTLAQNTFMSNVTTIPVDNQTIPEPAQ